MARCYNENNHAYKNYGHKNIKVCKRWHNLNNFIKDFDKIENFNYDLWLDGKLQLDKDLKQKNCKKKFILQKHVVSFQVKKNCEERNNTIIFYVVNPNGKLSKEKNLYNYCLKNNLNYRNCCNVLNNLNRHYKGYQFFKKQPKKEEILKKKKYLAIKPNGEKFYFHNTSYITKKYNIPKHTILRSVRNNSLTKENWKFILIQDGFVIL